MRAAKHQESKIEKIFLTDRELEDEKSKRIACTMCDADFPNYWARKYHIEIHHKKIRFSCSECDKLFKSIRCKSW